MHDRELDRVGAARFAQCGVDDDRAWPIESALLGTLGDGFDEEAAPADLLECPGDAEVAAVVGTDFEEGAGGSALEQLPEVDVFAELGVEGDGVVCARGVGDVGDVGTGARVWGGPGSLGDRGGFSEVEQVGFRPLESLLDPSKPNPLATDPPGVRPRHHKGCEGEGNSDQGEKRGHRGSLGVPA